MCEGPKAGRNLACPKNDKRSVCLQSNQQSDERSKVWQERYVKIRLYRDTAWYFDLERNRSTTVML